MYLYRSVFTLHEKVSAPAEPNEKIKGILSGARSVHVYRYCVRINLERGYCSFVQ